MSDLVPKSDVMPMSDVVFEAIGISKYFGGLKAVSDVSVTVRLGEIHAVIGPNGAGKTTLINLLSGDIPASHGTIRLDTRDISYFRQDKRSLSGVGRSYQKTTIFPQFSVFENVRLAAQARLPNPLGVFVSKMSRAKVLDKATQALQIVGLIERKAITARYLSHGEQRQLEIAMVLAGDPRIILLDEPLAGMGTAEAKVIVELIRTLKQSHAVLLVEHDMDAVFSLADRLTVMADGQVIASGLPEEIRVHPAVRTAYLGEADS
jgi:branched-chain amino acid transport system ATP-binding protein